MYSVQIETSDGTLSVINLGIEYFEKDDITLYRNDTENPLTLGVDWQWASDTSINLLLGVEPNGNRIIVLRTTDKDRAFNIYDGNAPFSRETLDENFRQMIYLAQEFTEGSGIAGLYRNLNMHSNRIVEVGDPEDAGDATNKGYVDDANAVQDNRIGALEGTFVTGTVSYPWFEVTSTTQDTFTPPFAFTKASVYIGGICQTPEYSYIVTDNTVMLAEPVPAGTLVFLRLGEDTDASSEYATAAQLANAVSTLQASIDATNVDVDAVQAAVLALQTAVLGKASSGANSDITSISGLLTPLSVSQGGTGGGTQAAARTGLGLGDSSTRNVGTTTGTVLDGAAVGRLLAIQRFTAAGTYTPTVGMTSCIVEVQAAGGGGGGAPTTAAAQLSGGCGGNSGAYARVQLTAAQVGASQAVAVGTAGVGAAGIAGTAGGQSSLGTIVVCPGGNGGAIQAAFTAVTGGTFIFPAARTTPTVSTGNVLSLLQSGQPQATVFTTTSMYASAGADSPMGSGGTGTANGAGTAATVNRGGGGGGAINPASTAARAGGAGAAGMVIVYEYS